MHLHMIWMFVLSATLSVVGMCLGSLLAGGNAITLLQMLFPVVIVVHSVIYLYGLAGIAVTFVTAFILSSDREARTKFLMATACVTTWTCIVYPLDKGYMK